MSDLKTGNVILIGGEKGGVGKSTSAVNLAVMSTIMGHDTILIDATIKQASSARFMDRRKEKGILPTPPYVRIQGKYLHAELEDLSNRCERAVVDVGGFDSVELRSAMAAKVVKRMYSPLKASEFDLETLETINELVYLARSYNPDLNCYVFFNQTPTTAGREELINDATELVKNYECLQMASSVLSNRMSVQEAAGSGLSVVEYEEERRQSMPAYRIKDYLFKGSIEFCNLYREVFNEEFKHPKFTTLGEYQQKNKEAAE